MKKTAVTLLLLFSILILQAQQLKVDPAFWWSGMQEPELQVMFYGEDIGNYTPTITSNDVVIKESVRLASPNYQILYLIYRKANLNSLIFFLPMATNRLPINMN